jgi:hypothetical protein
MPSRPVAWFAAAALGAFLARPALAEDPPKTPAPPTVGTAPGPASTFTDASGALTVTAPAGWTMARESTSSPSWLRICSFTDPTSKAVAVVFVRRAQAGSLSKLRDEVTKTFAEDATYRVTGVIDLPVAGNRPLPGLLVDAIQTRAGETLPSGAPGPAVAFRTYAAFFLAGDSEFLIQVQAKATAWPKVGNAIDKMIQGVLVKVLGSASLPKGENAFSDEDAGFACRYPTGYGVRVPKRPDEAKEEGAAAGEPRLLVEFAPATPGPVIGVYRSASEKDADAEGKAIADWLKGDEVGGEATEGSAQVSGRGAATVSGKGNVEGREVAVHFAVVKRGNDLFRVRVTGPADQPDRAKGAFDAFLKSFVLGRG